MECMRLRVKDIDFGNHAILVRNGKGADDRVTILPDSLVPALQAQIQTVQRIHQTDLADGFGEVHLPHALAVKYPNASRELAWQYLFPASAGARVENPFGPPQGWARVVRGGSWNNNRNNARCAYRNRNEPDNFNNNLGFRLALSYSFPPGQERRLLMGSGRG